MTELTDQDVEALPELSELDLLKQRADKLSIPYHPSIGVEKLRQKVSMKLPDGEKPKKVLSRKQILRNDASKLIRVRISCMNPNKKEWSGEIITVSNSIVGTFKEYIPFNAEEGWHIPNIIYKALLERKCQIFITTKDSRGNKVRKGKQIKEFAIEVLPQLSQKQLKDLAQVQAAAKNID